MYRFYIALSTACFTLISLYEFFSQYIVILTVRSERATERNFKGAKVPGNERARERKGRGARWPGSESARVLLADSLRGANGPGSEKARYRFHHVDYYGATLRLIGSIRGQQQHESH